MWFSGFQLECAYDKKLQTSSFFAGGKTCKIVNVSNNYIPHCMYVCINTRWLTSTILFFCGSLTFPARQQRDRALWMMNLLDLKLGSLKSFGPENANSGPVTDKWELWVNLHIFCSVGRCTCVIWGRRCPVGPRLPVLRFLCWISAIVSCFICGCKVQWRVGVDLC